MRTVQVKEIKIGSDNPLILIAGPCIIETEEIAIYTAQRIKEITSSLNIPFIYKSSFIKDNRTNPEAYRGPGIKRGMEILKRVKEEVNVPVTSDIHYIDYISSAIEILDLIQIPAYLSKQTRLIEEVGKTKIPINIKKFQLWSDPTEIKSAIKKLEAVGNLEILLTERGTHAGAGELYTDPRSFIRMRSLGYPTIFDPTHISRDPTKRSEDFSHGTKYDEVISMSRAAVATGYCDGLFIETHPNPKEALCDATSQFPLNQLEEFLKQIKELDNFILSKRLRS